MSGQANVQRGDIFTLDLATQALMAVNVSLVGNNTIAVSPQGTVYVNGASEEPMTTADEVLVFDPASQSVKGTFTTYSSGTLALNSTGSQLYFLNEQSSTLAETAPPPQTSLLGVAATGPLTSVAYDARNNLLLGVDHADNTEVLDAATLAPPGQLFISNLGYLYPAYLAARGPRLTVRSGLAPVKPELLLF